MKVKNVKLYSLQFDLNADKAIATVRKNMEQVRTVLLFDPEIYKANDPCLTVEQSKLGDDKLLSYGKLATKLRNKFAN